MKRRQATLSDRVLDVVIDELGDSRESLLFAAEILGLFPGVSIKRAPSHAALVRMRRIAKNARTMQNALERMQRDDLRKLQVGVEIRRRGRLSPRDSADEFADATRAWLNALAESAESIDRTSSWRPRYRPPDVDLNWMISRLALLWREIFGRRPPVSNQSPFVRVVKRVARLCNAAWRPSLSTIQRSIRPTDWSEVDRK